MCSMHAGPHIQISQTIVRTQKFGSVESVAGCREFILNKTEQIIECASMELYVVQLQQSRAQSQALEWKPNFLGLFYMNFNRLIFGFIKFIFHFIFYCNRIIVELASLIETVFQLHCSQLGQLLENGAQEN